MNDWTILIKNAVAVLVIVLAISVVTFLAFLGLSSANKGGNDLSDTVNVMDARTLEAYDQKEITGTAVVSLLKQYQNRGLAVLVRTKSSNYVNYNALLATEAQAKTMVGSHSKTYTPAEMANLFTVANGATADHTVGSLMTSLMIWETSQNINLVKATDSSYAEYINPGSKFRSVLIYDTSGEIRGILIEQIGITSGNIL